jgi:hypothetical protein
MARGSVLRATPAMLSGVAGLPITAKASSWQINVARLLQLAFDASQ